MCTCVLDTYSTVKQIGLWLKVTQAVGKAQVCTSSQIIHACTSPVLNNKGDPGLFTKRLYIQNG